MLLTIAQCEYLQKGMPSGPGYRFHWLFIGIEGGRELVTLSVRVVWWSEILTWEQKDVWGSNPAEDGTSESSRRTSKSHDLDGPVSHGISSIRAETLVRWEFFFWRSLLRCAHLVASFCHLSVCLFVCVYYFLTSFLHNHFSKCSFVTTLLT